MQKVVIAEVSRRLEMNAYASPPLALLARARAFCLVQLRTTFSRHDMAPRDHEHNNMIYRPFLAHEYTTPPPPRFKERCQLVHYEARGEQQ